MKKYLLCVFIALLGCNEGLGVAVKVPASERHDFEKFGSSVALDGRFLVVGAPNESSKGKDAGTVYVFEEVKTGTWFQRAKLFASDASESDRFGASIDIVDETIVVGAPMRSDAGHFSGAVYIFALRADGKNGKFEEIQKISASDASSGDQFGKAIAMTGRVLFVGAPEHEHAGRSSGAVYVFEKKSQLAQWKEAKKLIASDASKSDNFGASVDTDGQVMVVGAPFRSDAGTASGAAYVFEQYNEASSWREFGKLVASNAAPEDLFGDAVAVDGKRIVVGAPGSDRRGSNSGSVYVFERESGILNYWEEKNRIEARGGKSGFRFGEALDVEGDVIVVGVKRSSDGKGKTGMVYVLTSEDSSWRQKKNVAFDRSEGDSFGASVAISSGVVAAGAPYDDDTGDASGSVYVLDI